MPRRAKKERPRKWRGIWNEEAQKWACGACGTPLPPSLDTIKHIQENGQNYWLVWYHCTACIHQTALCVRPDLSGVDAALTAEALIPSILEPRVG